MIEPLLLTAAQISTFNGTQLLTRASSFFFARDKRLFLVTSRHVLIDKPSKHFPNRIEIELHTEAANLTRSTGLSVLLYREGKSIWRQGRDPSGEIDVAVIELDRDAMPEGVELRAFTPDHLVDSFDEVEVGSPLLIVGFPLGFHDTLHHLPVVRQAVIASSFGLRFQGQGFFLTDARTHRGTSGAPVVMRAQANGAETDELHWNLLGVHSSRMDMRTRDRREDESLGLNCAWYADILMTLTEPVAGAVTPEA
ncbi:MAG: trypsin-like peptidase domain-containing protein [Rhizobacter sp.]|nr:trypsin-like peptidase domain-containing protein [Rhizobacter sp.]